MAASKAMQHRRGYRGVTGKAEASVGAHSAWIAGGKLGAIMSDCVENCGIHGAMLTDQTRHGY